MSQVPLSVTPPDQTNSRVKPTNHRWRSVAVNPYLYGLLVLALFLGTVQVARVMNFWSTSGKVTGAGEKIQPTGTNPAEIKGWMTINDVLTAYKVPQAEFYAGLNLPADLPLTTQMKDIEKKVPGFSVDAVRTWLTQYQTAKTP